ncbi:MAG: sigma-70 family RNA polymerase sigma factor [Oscillospiraceae bacterium]|nr:sigma-70 family RNA polymerase sigma factor [Oscillospiraceae bacterium]
MTDAERFDAIYREYRPKVSQYISSRVADPEDAQDLCSEVFRKALEHLDLRSGAGVSSYIYTVTRNTVVDYYRTRRIHAPLEEDLPEEGGPEEDLLRADSLSRLAGALSGLPERQRDIIVLHYYSGCTLQEVSERMSLPYSVVKRAHRSALERLRSALEQE